MRARKVNQCPKSHPAFVSVSLAAHLLEGDALSEVPQNHCQAREAAFCDLVLQNERKLFLEADHLV